MRTAFAALLVALAVAVPATPARAACNVDVHLPNFSPVTLTVKPGTTVTWCWTDGINHSVHGDTFISTIKSSGTFMNTFATKGTFAYHCDVHSTSMIAEVVVTDATPSPTKTKPPATTPVATTTAPKPASTTTRPASATTSQTPTAPPRTTEPATTPPAAAVTTTAPAPSETPAANVGEPPRHRDGGVPLLAGLILAGVAAGGAALFLRTRTR